VRERNGCCGGGAHTQTHTCSAVTLTTVKMLQFQLKFPVPSLGRGENMRLAFKTEQKWSQLFVLKVEIFGSNFLLNHGNKKLYTNGQIELF